MTTQSWSTVVDHSSDAAFRAWGLELSTKLAAAGLVHASDTGQINWATVNRAGTSAEAGFEIWKLNDSLFASAPVYFRIGYGTAGVTTAPRIQITVGTGTDGAGTITGTAISIARTLGSGNTPASTVTAYQSYLCVTEGFFGLYWKYNNQCRAGFTFSRTVDSTGAYTATGAFVHWAGQAGGSGVTQALRFAATAQAFTATSTFTNSQYCLVPQSPTSSVVGSDFQAFLWWTITPAMAPLIGVCTVYSNEVSVGNTFSVALVGASAHTYLALDSNFAPGSAFGGAHVPAMLWE